MAKKRFLEGRSYLIAAVGLICAQAQGAGVATAGASPKRDADTPLLLAANCLGACRTDAQADGFGATLAQAATPAPSTASGDEAAYRAAITDARAGNNMRAAAALKALSERHPERADMRNDYIVVLGWAGDDVTAVSLAGRVDQDSAPAYVLESLAGSARRQKNAELAQRLYARGAQRFPQRVEPRVGLVYTALDAGRTDDAARQVADLAQAYPRNREVRLAQGDVATARGDYFGALNAYQSVLDQTPEDRAALQGKARTLVRLGTPQLATELAQAHPAAFSQTEVQAFSADSTAHQIRWGMAAADRGHGPQRFAELDRALAQSDAVVPRALDRNVQLTPAERTLALDRIGALQARVRMQEAVDLYEALAARPEPMPGYAKSYAAGAYLYLRKPERARDLYREAVAADPTNTGAQIGLFYALAECEQHKEALAQIDKVAAATPETINAYSAATTQPNPDYLPLQIARSLQPLLAGNPGESYWRLRALHARAPSNIDVDTAYASSMRARGWPRQAEQELRGVLTADPNDGGALGERAGALLEMRDYRAAEAELAAARAADAEDQRVIRSGRLWEVHNMRQLIVESGFGRSSDGPTGNHDFELDAMLYTAPFNYNYRAFAHAYTSQAKFDTGTGRYDRAGIGLEYRSTRWLASGEIAQDINRSRGAASGSVAFTPDDFWTINGFAESDTLETPLQARLAGVTAYRFGAGLTWRAHESRRAGLTLSRMNFSDGNQRNAALAAWTERVVAGPVYRLELTGSFATSRNSNVNTPYFNPARDEETTVQMTNEWLQWRRYERAFRHRLVLAAGNYWQQNFGSGPAYDAHYEQEWSADDRLILRYGIGRSLHPYDGVRVGRTYGYLAVNWRF